MRNMTACITMMRHRMRRAPLGALMVVAALTPAAAAASDADHGRVLFQTCAACHHDGANPLGPNLRGVFGRKAAALEDYRYSGPMTRASFVWDEASLKAYISDPQKKVPGNRMPFGGVTNSNDLEDILAYLKNYK
jgi:cytochrome c